MSILAKFSKRNEPASSAVVDMTTGSPQFVSELQKQRALEEKRQLEQELRSIEGVHADMVDRAMGARPLVCLQDYLNLYGENGPRWVYAGVRAIAQDVSTMRQRAIDVTTSEEVEFPHIAFERPFPDYSIEEHTEALIVYLMLTGNAAEYVDYSNELRLLPVHRMNVYPDDNGQVVEYGIYSKDGAHETFLPAERVIHHRLPNPNSPYWGIGPIQAGSRSVMMADGEDLWMLGFYKNGARLGGFIKFDKSVSFEKAKAAMSEFRQSYSGARNSGKIAGMPGADFVRVQTDPAEGGIVEIKRMTREEFLALLNVPPFRVHVLEHANYANAREQGKLYYKTTVLPLGRRICWARNRNRILVPNPERVKVSFHEAAELSQFRDEDKIANAARTAVESGVMKRNEAREKFYDLAEMDIEGIPETGPITISPSPGQEPPPLDEAEEPEDVEEPEDEGTLSVQAEMDAMHRATTEYRRLIYSPSGPPIRVPRFGKFRRIHENVWKERQVRRETRFERKIKSLLDDMVSELETILDEGDRAASGSRSMPKELEIALRSWDLDKYQGRIADEWTPEITRILVDEGKVHTRMVGLPSEHFDMTNPRVEEFINERAGDLVTNVTKATKTAVRVAVDTAYGEGETLKELRDRLMNSPEIGNSKVRAMRIARTETASAANTGAMESYRQASEAGVDTKKSWLTVGDGRKSAGGNVRDSHMDAEEQGAIPLAERFVNGLLYPGDPEGPPEEVVNDRCTLVPEVE